jgi:hypothetical protein
MVKLTEAPPMADTPAKPARQVGQPAAQQQQAAERQ